MTRPRQSSAAPRWLWAGAPDGVHGLGPLQRPGPHVRDGAPATPFCQRLPRHGAMKARLLPAIDQGWCSLPTSLQQCFCS